jgi:hypothetical protein
VMALAQGNAAGLALSGSNSAALIDASADGPTLVDLNISGTSRGGVHRRDMGKRLSGQESRKGLEERHGLREGEQC